MTTPDRTNLTGLEQLLDMVEGREPPARMQLLLGMRLTHASPGKVVIESKTGEQFLNRLGTLHGGYAASLLDSAASLAAVTVVGKGESAPTIDLSVNYLRALLPATGALMCEGTVIESRGRYVLSEARLTDGDGTLYAYATATCLRIRDQAHESR